ncbi:MAG: 30S ribosomal protein S1 [Deltaproteobacteria bacterium]|nr:30S ribosomal protein S1 [Deltaproteobacteria bacterium]
MSKEFKNGESEDFAELFESFTSGMGERLRVGDRITGPIIAIGKDSVFVDTGTKIDGIVDSAELLDENGKLPYNLGDNLELYVVSLRGDEVRLSKAVSGAGGTRALSEAYENAIPVEGKVKGQVKGGFHVEVMQKRSFCPVSQMEMRFTEKPEVHVGKTYHFLITQFEEGGRNIVLSRRELLRKEHEKEVKKFLETLKVGSDIQGKVTRLTPYGAFVEIFPNLEGMIHISELSWSRVEKPGDVVQVDDPVMVRVMGIDHAEKLDQSRISLSMKLVTGDPWLQAGEKFQIGEKLKGKVIRCTKFGAFVEIAPGIEGLVHISEMSYTKRVIRTEDELTPGDLILVVVKEVDLPRKRISLSIKDAEGDPWNDIEEKYHVGQRTEGTLEKKEKFGFFIALEPGITGLLPVSKIKAAQKASSVEKLKPGDPITILIEEIQPMERRMTLGVADSMEEDDWKKFSKKEDYPSTVLGEKLKKAMENKRK